LINLVTSDRYRYRTERVKSQWLKAAAITPSYLIDANPGQINIWPTWKGQQAIETRQGYAGFMARRR
jgi:hypothetical protein